MDGESDSVVSNEDNSRKGIWPKSFPCRFCFRKFSTFRGLGGHMNNHRRERQNEKYEKAKALLEQNYRRMNNQLVAPQNYASIPRGVQIQDQTWGQAGCSSSLSTYSNQNVGGGILGVGPSLPTSYLNQQQKDHNNYQMRETYPSDSNNPHYQRNNNLQIGGTERILEMMNNQHVAPQNYASIPGGVQTQVQRWAQAGYPSSFSTYSYQNEGGGVSGVGPSLPTSYLNQQQQDHTNYQQQQKQQEYSQNPGDLTNYQMRERYPSHHNHQMRETYPSHPYQTNNNLQIGGGASLVNNSGIRGPSLPMNNHLQIRGASFPTLQGGNPNLVMGRYAAASASEQHQQFFSSSAQAQDSEDVISE